MPVTSRKGTVLSPTPSLSELQSCSAICRSEARQQAVLLVVFPGRGSLWKETTRRKDGWVEGGRFSFDIFGIGIFFPADDKRAGDAPQRGKGSCAGRRDASTSAAFLLFVPGC